MCDGVRIPCYLPKKTSKSAIYKLRPDRKEPLHCRFRQTPISAYGSHLIFRMHQSAVYFIFFHSPCFLLRIKRNSLPANCNLNLESGCELRLPLSSMRAVSTFMFADHPYHTCHPFHIITSSLLFAGIRSYGFIQAFLSISKSN